MIKKAMIMSAGVGSRLGALSNTVPKPLVPLANIPAIDIILKHIASCGIKDVIANTFYKAEDIEYHCKNNDFNIKFTAVREKELSGTAGGLGKCRFFFDDADDFIVMSGDGLSDIDVQAAYESHKKANTIATIVTKEVTKSEVSKYGIIVTDTNGIVESFQEKPSIEDAKSNLANTGIYIFKKEIFDYIPENTFFDFAKNLFPVLMDKGISINSYNHRGYWSDIGSIEQYKKSNADILNNLVSSVKADIIKLEKGKFILGENTDIGEGAEFIGINTIGKNCEIGKNCVIKNSILWDNIKVQDNVIIDNSIILSGTNVLKSVKNGIMARDMNPVTV